MHTEAPQCSLARGKSLAPCLQPRNRPTLTVGARDLHSCTQTRRAPCSAVQPPAGAGPRTGPCSDKAFRCGVFLITPFSQEKKIPTPSPPLAITSSLRQAHSPPVSSCTREPSKKVRGGGTCNSSPTLPTPRKGTVMSTCAKW